MKRHTASFAIAALAVLAVGCSSDDEPAAAPASEPEAAPAAEPEAEAEPAATADAVIQIEGFAFSALGPVAGGTEISVVNLDGAQHTLTADDGSFNTGGLDGEATTTIVAPDASGTYSFLCNIHPTMTGTLTVDG